MNGTAWICQVLDTKTCRPLQEVETRPLEGTANFDGSGKGGLEYRVLEPSLKEFYLHLSVDRVEECGLSHHILPLVIGPVRIVQRQELSHPTNAPIEMWPDNTPMVHTMYRSFSHTIVQESWDAGIPGKIWDSAVVMLEFLNNMTLKDVHVVDLSAGTGLLGFHVNNRIEKGRVTITELDEALDLIRHNAALNHQQPSIRPLLWGDKTQAAACGKADIIVASDVLYEAEFFDDLVNALDDLSTSSTRIYIGYKRRGLDSAEEERFWKTCTGHGFSISLLSNPDDPEHKLVPELAQQTGVHIYRLTRS
ncbi:putative methyltransferase-domain-containing protein [Fennellomyces sp. T-0311]|nr:putative methyltransferase-domain-containing protein [Fennellomyces sp. T-0311]